MVPSTIPVVEDKSLKTQYQVSYVPVKAMEVDPAAVKGNPRALPTMSPAPARSCPRSRPCSQSVCRPNRRHLVPVPVLASQLVVTDLVAPSLMAEPVCQRSVAGAVWYLMRQAGIGAATVHSAVCHHDPDCIHPVPWPRCCSGRGILATPLPPCQHCTRSSQTTCSCQTCCRS